MIAYMQLAILCFPLGHEIADGSYAIINYAFFIITAVALLRDFAVASARSPRLVRGKRFFLSFSSLHKFPHP